MQFALFYNSVVCIREEILYSTILCILQQRNETHMIVPTKRYSKSIEEMKDSLDAFTYNEGYVVCKFLFDMNCNHKYNRRQIYYDQNCHTH